MTPSTIVLETSEGLRLASDIQALADRLYGGTSGRSRYRLRLRPDLYRRFALFVLTQNRVFAEYQEPLKVIVINDKAVVVSR